MMMTTKVKAINEHTCTVFTNCTTSTGTVATGSTNIGSTGTIATKTTNTSTSTVTTNNIVSGKSSSENGKKINQFDKITTDFDYNNVDGFTTINGPMIQT